jgi:hypothetical protein
MKVTELEERLLEEGCNPIHFAIGQQGSDVYCLQNQNGTWRVFYTERGKDDPPIYESADEEAACKFYFEYITTRIRHDHLVGFFREEGNVQALHESLARNGIPSHRDKIPYGGWADPRYRVFVVGKDIFRVKEMFGEIPLRD